MKFKSLFVVFLVLGASFFLPAQDTTKILFIGNSFTYYHSMPQIVKALADSAHLPVVWGMHAPGGVSVGDTVQGTWAHMNNPQLFQLIRSKKWDFAVIQDNQGRFVRDSAVFPGSSKVVQGHLNIMDSVKTNNSCAKIVLFAGWAFKYGSPPFGNTGIEMIERILTNYTVLNDTMKEVIAPIGEGWIRAINYLPAVNLWDPDDAHPSYAGSYLTASVIFSTIFNLPAKTLSYTGLMAPTDAYKLRAFGDSAVFNTATHTTYNLDGVKKVNPVYGGGQLSVPGSFSSCHWYKNGVFVGSGSPLSLLGNGNYKAEITENDGCIVKSCVFNFLTTGTIEEALPRVQVFPNPVSQGSFLVRSQEVPEQVLMFNSAGAAVPLDVTPSGRDVLVSRAHLPPGYYTLVLKTKRDVIRTKLILN